MRRFDDNEGFDEGIDATEARSCCDLPDPLVILATALELFATVLLGNEPGTVFQKPAKLPP
jgi:hypothetical protein